mgnify:CR=1 FL=1
MQKKDIKWWVVILFLIVFWPVGLILLIVKLAMDNSAIMGRKTTVIKVVCITLTVIGVIGLIAETSPSTASDDGGLVLAIFFLVVGIIFLIIAIRNTKLAKMYRSFLDLIVNQKIKRLDYISISLGLPYEKVKENIEGMIKRGFLKDAYIDYVSNEIILLDNTETQYTVSQPVKAATQQTTIQCPGCGANNVVTIGVISECEYCGTKISAK